MCQSIFRQQTEQATQKLAKETHSYLKQLPHLFGDLPSDRVCKTLISNEYLRYRIMCKRIYYTDQELSSCDAWPSSEVKERDNFRKK